MKQKLHVISFYVDLHCKVGVLNPNTLENTFLLNFENTC